MQNLQEVFNRLQSKKHERKEIQAEYKDALNNSVAYKEAVEKWRAYGLRKKQLQEEIKAELGQKYIKLEALKKDMELDKELLTDIALSNIAKGEKLELSDSEGNEYEPVFKVTFKKTKIIGK